MFLHELSVFPHLIWVNNIPWSNIGLWDAFSWFPHSSHFWMGSVRFNFHCFAKPLLILKNLLPQVRWLFKWLSWALCSRLFVGDNIVVWGGSHPLFLGHGRIDSNPSCTGDCLLLKRIWSRVLEAKGRCYHETLASRMSSFTCPCPLWRSCTIYFFLNDGCVRAVVFH